MTTHVRTLYTHTYTSPAPSNHVTHCSKQVMNCPILVCSRIHHLKLCTVYIYFIHQNKLPCTNMQICIFAIAYIYVVSVRMCTVVFVVIIVIDYRINALPFSSYFSPRLILTSITYFLSKTEVVNIEHWNDFILYQSNKLWHLLQTINLFKNSQNHYSIILCKKLI